MKQLPDSSDGPMGRYQIPGWWYDSLLPSKTLSWWRTTRCQIESWHIIHETKWVRRIFFFQLSILFNQMEMVCDARTTTLTPSSCQDVRKVVWKHRVLRTQLSFSEEQSNSKGTIPVSVEQLDVHTWKEANTDKPERAKDSYLVSHYCFHIEALIASIMIWQNSNTMDRISPKMARWENRSLHYLNHNCFQQSHRTEKFVFPQTSSMSL